MDSDSTLEKITLEIRLPNGDSKVGNRFTRRAIPQLSSCAERGSCALSVQACWYWRPWSRSNGILFSGFEVGEGLDVRAVSGSEVSYHSHLCSPLARSALAGATGAGPGEDSSPSLSQSALSTQDLCGAIARRRHPAGTRNESTDPDIAASRLRSGRIAGIESAAAEGNDGQPRYDTPAGEADLGPVPRRGRCGSWV